ncbi:MAG TPA: mannitol dehydrogenase family protein [Casimicrobiaceae bacterium]|nr:mannitol dehydrogenase family protein [Casimicrobiaceae bacterium]
MNRLSLETLAGLPASVVRPNFDPARVAAGILHLGLGAFHRAHQAVYTDDVLAADPRWGICGVSLKTPRAIDALAAQDGLYTLLTRSGDGVAPRVIGSLRETLFAGADRARLIARFADPKIMVVSATVTEKGYCHDPATGALNFAHPEIVHDLAHPDAPESAVGMVVAGLAARRAADAGPVTFVCCDNLPHNGRLVEGLVLALADRRDPALAAWIRADVTFPCTMVDRIVPATTAADLADAQRLLGVSDAAPVAAEPFGQWIIEDRFAGARPPWDAAGAQFVADVAPFEWMKLRLLNGSHSTLAYLGFMLGHEFVWQASQDRDLAQLVERQMATEIVPTLTPPPGIDLRRYCGQLLERFRNSALPHRTQQIAMDGSQKLPQRLLGTIRDRMRAGASWRHLALAVAAWIRYAGGVDERGAKIDVKDPLAPAFADIVRDAQGDPLAIADGFLDLKSVFGSDLAAHHAFRESVRANVIALFRDGTRATLSRHLAAG